MVDPAHFQLHEWLADPRRNPAIMGVLNVTPDSFSDGGQWIDPAIAVDRALAMVAEGAAVIDVGGESTRPGSQPVAEDEQVRRIVPVIRAIAKASLVVISIDTTRAKVAEAALDAGAMLVNDVSAGRDDEQLIPLVARRGAVLSLMHMQGTPATMQVRPTYQNVTDEVRSFLLNRLKFAQNAGVDPLRILLDPGIGFGKTDAHNLALLAELKTLAEIGRPLLVGTSRKGFIGRITGETDPADRRFGTAATVAWAIANGATMLRVHDVEPMARVMRMIRAIQNASSDENRANHPAP